MKKIVHRWLYGTLAFVMLLLLALVGGSCYMLRFALSPDEERRDDAHSYTMLYERVPDMRLWVDSVQVNHLLRDTFITMDDGRRAHALYLRCDTAHGRTAVLVHGYKDSAIRFLYMGRLYQRDLGCNVLLPDLNAHGQSEGETIQMGWKDRLDVLRWTEVARELFADARDSVRMVVHGVSMGAATTMSLSGENTPAYIKCFVEDCGYTSVWDEFEEQLHDMFGLPSFPLMWSTSALCQARYGWSFGEASPLKQVARCKKPMLFIHGTHDTFVPTRMVHPLYAAKPNPKELWLVDGAEHAKSYTDHPQEYTARVRAFLDKWLR